MNAGCEKCDATGNAECAAIANDWDSTAPSATATLGIALQAHDDFVDVVFDKPASRVMSSKFDTSLLLSIVAITTCVPGVDPRETNYGTQCAQLAQRLIVSDLGRPTILKAQAMLLVIRYHMWTAKFTEALMLMGTLTRFAFALRLNYENPNICSLAQESRRRLMWGIYILDTMLADTQNKLLRPHTTLQQFRTALEN
ncbi:uncharacterized protein PFLUO_LOCUS100 [Penicillium psychrofluorescens]|uniref:uncharacterized protein n=1 Tax=Penicillium psychrofluorescens TaxID=3158075 RepID=UPI003CCD4F6B